MDDIGSEVLVDDILIAREKIEISVNVAMAANRLARLIGLARPYPHRYRNVVDQPPPCADESSSGLPEGTHNSTETEPAKKTARTAPSPGLLGVDPTLRKYLHNYEPVLRFRGFVKKWKDGKDLPWIATRHHKIYEISKSMLIA